MDRADLYHNMTSNELNEKLLSLKQELFNLRFQHSTGQLKNPLMLSTVKKDIARVMTIQKEREANLPRNAGKKTAKKTTKGGKN
jgi:large subunit ribosomal protein L29